MIYGVAFRHFLNAYSKGRTSGSSAAAESSGQRGVSDEDRIVAGGRSQLRRHQREAGYDRTDDLPMEEALYSGRLGGLGNLSSGASAPKANAAVTSEDLGQNPTGSARWFYPLVASKNGRSHRRRQGLNPAVWREADLKPHRLDR